MKQALFIISAFCLIILNVGCTETPAGGLGLEGTYVGQMNVDSSFQHISYSVVVSEVGATSVQISPSTNDASEWTSTLMSIGGIYTCVTCTSNQITFTPINGVMQLSYNYAGTEQYTGTKQ